jgi:ABC-2 type transport system ATP-binding protein
MAPSSGLPARCGRTFDVPDGSWLRALSHERHRSLRSTEALRQPSGCRRRLVRGRGRRDLRHPRTERGRQDHDRRVDRRSPHPRPERITVREAVDLFASFYTEPSDPRALIGDLGLDDQRGTAYKNLSGGQKQRLSIALALVGRPKIAILDELSTGLDPQARRETWHLIESIRDRGVTILLVTHLMEEAERLADRVAVFGAGRVIALDTPAGIVAMVDQEQRLRFRPSVPIEDRLLTDLPEVRRLERSGPFVTVTGTGNLIGAVTSVLARQQVVANDLRVEQANLDDAFIALTGRLARTAGELS